MHNKLALKTALSVKQAGGKLVILDDATSKTGKTADLVKKLENMVKRAVKFLQDCGVRFNELLRQYCFCKKMVLIQVRSVLTLMLTLKKNLHQT